MIFVIKAYVTVYFHVALNVCIRVPPPTEMRNYACVRVCACVHACVTVNFQPKGSELLNISQIPPAYCQIDSHLYTTISNGY